MSRKMVNSLELVSFIIPIYNNEKFLKEAIESIISINYRNIEIIAIDDGGIDNSANIIKQFQIRDNRIKFFKNEKNIGTARTLKKGIELSRGKYVFLAAADDVSLPDRVEKCLNIFKHNSKIGIIASNAIIIDENGRETGEVFAINNDIHNGNVCIEQFKRNYCLGATMAIVNDKSILLKEEMLEYIDDYEISIEYILNGYNIFLCRDYLVKYRMHNTNQSNNSRVISDKAKSVLKKYQDKVITDNLKSRGYKDREIFVALGVSNLFKDNIKSGHKYLLMAYETDYETCSKKILFEINFYLGVSYYKLGKLNESLERFRLAFKIDKYDPSLLNNLGVLEILLYSNIEASKEIIASALTIYPGYVDARNNLNNILQGKIDILKITERILDVQLYKREKYIV
ncbi:putative glycosyltransferase MJ1057 [Proteiniborus sp. DW1]|uniref:glycosyltransferase n=1 Tax=Proteiniborus sp. DW1 TaxID=1889883 RepID=UPI00092E1492|nr:glycosyltransferase [Proteiniborus sp. DW1]SCG81925.1 putative glycosyltransferase MJ1057 [Proteiniborus sp. DW1]